MCVLKTLQDMPSDTVYKGYKALAGLVVYYYGNVESMINVIRDQKLNLKKYFKSVWTICVMVK